MRRSEGRLRKRSGRSCWRHSWQPLLSGTPSSSGCAGRADSVGAYLLLGGDRMGLRALVVLATSIAIGAAPGVASAAPVPPVSDAARAAGLIDVRTVVP